MLPDILDSLFRPAAYRRFATEPAPRSAAYAAFLSVVFIGALGLSVKLRLVPVFDRTFAWLETSMPPLRISGGKVTSTAAPVRLVHPEFKSVAVEIDTTRAAPVTPKDMEALKVRAFLSQNALYIENEGTVQVLDLSRGGEDQPVLLDADSYRAMHRSFDWVFYPALLLTFFLLFAASLAAFGVVYAAAGLLAGSLSGAGLSFMQLWRIALHAQTAAALLRALDTALPFPIPGLVYASPLISAGYMWLGLRGARGNAPPAEPAPAAPPAA